MFVVDDIFTEQHFVKPNVDFVAGAPPFVNFKVQTSRQAQHFVTEPRSAVLVCAPLCEPPSADFVAGATTCEPRSVDLIASAACSLKPRALTCVRTCVFVYVTYVCSHVCVCSLLCSHARVHVFAHACELSCVRVILSHLYMCFHASTCVRVCCMFVLSHVCSCMILYACLLSYVGPYMFAQMCALRCVLLNAWSHASVLPVRSHMPPVLCMLQYLYPLICALESVRARASCARRGGPVPKVQCQISKTSIWYKTLSIHPRHLPKASGRSLLNATRTQRDPRRDNTR